MKNTERNSTLLLLCTLMLTACGGGGGSAGSMGTTDLTTIGWSVDASTTRGLVTGSMAPTHTPVQSDQEIASVEAIADSLITSDVFGFVDGTDGFFRFDTRCSGTTCSFTVLGETYLVRLDPGARPDAYDLQPIMVHNGVHIFQARARDDIGTDNQREVVLYGGWLQYSAFDGQESYRPVQSGYERGDAYASSWGDSTGTNPTEISGRTATWVGAVSGADYSSVTSVIHGTAQVDVDFVNSDVDLTFFDLVNLNHPGRSIANMEWSDIPLSDGSFSRGFGANQIKGQFYGPNHEEVGGVFDRNNIVGAFGAIRGTQ